MSTPPVLLSAWRLPRIVLPVMETAPPFPSTVTSPRMRVSVRVTEPPSFNWALPRIPLAWMSIDFAPSPDTLPPTRMPLASSVAPASTLRFPRTPVPVSVQVAPAGTTSSSTTTAPIDPEQVTASACAAGATNSGMAASVKTRKSLFIDPPWSWG